MSIGHYFDYNATTPASALCADAVKAALDIFANPSAHYGLAQSSKSLIAGAREGVARLIGAEPEQIFFTAGGTEANNWVINSVLRAQSGAGGVVTTAIEHDAVLLTARRLCGELGRDLTIVQPQAHGGVTAEAVGAAVSPETSLIAVMLANNETGVIQPVPAIAALARERGIFLHVDAVQAVGKIATDVNRLGCDSLSLSAHKFHGPKGIGALYLREPDRVGPWTLGGGQERGKRSGTENTIGIAGLGAAAEEARVSLGETDAHVRALRSLLLRELAVRQLCFELNGGDPAQGVDTLPNTLNLSFTGIRGESLAAYLTMKHDISVSIGSACGNNKSVRHSHVLKAMGLSEARIKATIRISFGRYTRSVDIHRLADALEQGVAHLGAIAEVA